MYCKLCRFRDKDSVCHNKNLTEPEGSIEGVVKPGGHRLVYSYPENGRFYVEDYFGCVHFERNEELFEAVDEYIQYCQEMEDG